MPKKSLIAVLGAVVLMVVASIALDLQLDLWLARTAKKLYQWIPPNI